MKNRIYLGNYKDKTYIYDIKNNQIMVARDENVQSKYILSAQSIYVLSLIILRIVNNAVEVENRMVAAISIFLISLIVVVAAYYGSKQLVEKPNYRTIYLDPDSLEDFAENLEEANHIIMKVRILTLILSIVLAVVYLLNFSFIVLIVYATSLYFLVLSHFINLPKRRELAKSIQAQEGSI